MAKDHQTLMRDWRDSFGKPVRQLTVQNQSTKDNVGTLPLFAYSTPDPPPRTLDFSITASAASRNTETQPEPHNVAANSVLIVKRDHICGVINKGPFFVGTVKADISDKEQNNFCDVQLFVPSFEDCLLLKLKGRERIHQDAIAGKVDEGDFERGDNLVKLTEMSYKAFLRYQNDVEDLLLDKESCKEASDLDSMSMIRISSHTWIEME